VTSRSFARTEKLSPKPPNDAIASLEQHLPDPQGFLEEGCVDGLGALSLFLVLFIWFLAHPTAYGQRSPERIVSPEVGADHRVTIRFRAPKARRVMVFMHGYCKPLRFRRPMGAHRT